jgi:hypothetical protein
MNVWLRRWGATVGAALSQSARPCGDRYRPKDVGKRRGARSRFSYVRIYSPSTLSMLSQSTWHRRKRTTPGPTSAIVKESPVTRLAKQRVLSLLFASTFALAAPSAHAIDLVVHASMVVKALKTQVFKDKGRYYLQRPDRCNDPYLENPTVSFKQGRVYVGAHFAGRIGALIGGVCQSATEPSAIMLSARPVVRSQQAALEDVRLEGADKT